ncbi:hypothetical protein ACFL5Z_07075 [Planctomycetota bacterium]
MIYRLLRKLKTLGTLYKDDAGVRTSSIRWRQELVCLSKKLNKNDIKTVLDAFSGNHVKPYDLMVDNPTDNGIGLRIDLSRGLTMDAQACLQAMKHFDFKAWLLFPVASAGDMGYVCEGKLFLDRKTIEFLRFIRRSYACRLGFLADPSYQFGRTLSTPINTSDLAKTEFENAGIPISGCGCSFHRKASSVYNLMWVYHICGRLRASSPPFQALDASFDCSEWSWFSNRFGECIFNELKDGLEEVQYLHDQSVSNCHSRAFTCTLKSSPQIRRQIELDLIIYTDKGGWWIIQPDGSEEPVETHKLIKIFNDIVTEGRIGCIIDPADVLWDEKVETIQTHPSKDDSRIEERALRVLPFPYHHYLSINSDIDWSMHVHVEESLKVICDNLGLSFGGSAFPVSRNPNWVSWDTAVNGQVDLRLARWASQGIFDTFHGLAHSFDTLSWLDKPVDADEVVDIRIHPGVRLSGYWGIILLLAGDTESPTLFLEMENDSVVGPLQSTPYPAEENKQFLFTLPTELTAPVAPAVKSIRVQGLAKGDRVLKLESAVATREHLGYLLEEVKNYGFTMPIFTSHGGGIDVRRLGACITEKWRMRSPEPEEVAFAMDRPDTPYYVLPVLQKHGVIFYNPIGGAGTKQLSHIASLLEKEHTRDGYEIYTFRRFASRRYEEQGGDGIWTYHKRTSSLQGLASNIDDILERLHWLSPGFGCILYTHLGHKVGNQICPRLGWNEELFAAWSRLAEFIHSRDRINPVPFRIWFTPASSVLSFAAVMKGLPKAIKRDGDHIYITSWYDSCLGHHIPDPAGFGASWLHGVTFYISDPEKAKIFVDDVLIQHVTKNPPDVLGGPSITLVDDSCKRSLIPDVPPPGCANISSALQIEIPDPQGPTILCPSVGQEDENGEWVLPVHGLSLRNVTHWTFEVLAAYAAIKWKIGFQTENGYWYEAGTTVGIRWPLPSPPSNTWHRYTLAFIDGSDVDFAEPIRSKITAIIIWIGKKGENRDLLFRDISILRPRPCVKDNPNRRILSGVVKSYLSGQPVVGEEILCQTPDKMLSVRTDERGIYVFRYLPDNIRARIELKNREMHARYMCGNVAYMTCDQWDWDIEIVDIDG